MWFGLWTLRWASAIHICSHMIKHIIQRMFYHSPQSCQWQITCWRILEAQFKINENHVALMQWDGWKVNPLKSISKPHLHWHHFYKILSHYGDFTLDSSMFYSQTFFFPQNTNSCWTSGSDWLSVCLQENWSKISGHLPVDIQKRNVYQWTAGTWFHFCSSNISLAGSEDGGRGSKNVGGP